MTAPAWTFKLLYDGDCPFCLREVRWLQRRDTAGRLAFEDIAAPGFDAVRYGTTRDELMGVMHGVFPDGRVVRRLEAFRAAYSAVGLGWLLAPTGWPLLRWPCNAGYALFARHRVRIGRIFGRECPDGACGIDRPRPGG
jgi:predicted DCC family thiol-disulfide oxidoreductase YuxK